MSDTNTPATTAAMVSAECKEALPSYGTGAPPPTVPLLALPFPFPLPGPQPSSSKDPINSGNSTVEFLSFTIHEHTVELPLSSAPICSSVQVDPGSSV